MLKTAGEIISIAKAWKIRFLLREHNLIRNSRVHVPNVHVPTFQILHKNCFGRQ